MAVRSVFRWRLSVLTALTITACGDDAAVDTDATDGDASSSGTPGTTGTSTSTSGSSSATTSTSTTTTTSASSSSDTGSSSTTDPTSSTATGSSSSGGSSSSTTGEAACLDGSECGTECCEGDAVCLAGACVTPGDDCTTHTDCTEGEYCEPALGSQPGDQCPATATGACLATPPTCDLGNNPPGCAQSICDLDPEGGLFDLRVQYNWGHDPAPTEFVAAADVWNTPAVSRLVDTNCDGTLDAADTPVLAFVSGDANDTICQTNGNCRDGVLRVVAGDTGSELWSLDAAELTSVGFAGTSVAIADVDADGEPEVIALTGEGRLAIIGADGVVEQVSTELVDGSGNQNFGSGGGLSVGDVDADGWPEVAYGHTVFTLADGNLAVLFTGALSHGGSNPGVAISHFVDLDGDGELELLAGNTAYETDGTVMWSQVFANDGFTAVADFDGDTEPEVVNVSTGGFVMLLEGVTGELDVGASANFGGGGGPPAVADFDGDGNLEIAVVFSGATALLRPNYVGNTLDTVWTVPNHEVSSGITTVTAFDFHYDGSAELVVSDECFTSILRGTDGTPFATASTQSFSGTESPVVADIDGDGRAEIAVVHTAVDTDVFSCAEHTTGMDGFPIWSPPAVGDDYRGITVYDSLTDNFLATRSTQNQHAYSVTNICDGREDTCAPGTPIGTVPTLPLEPWTLDWLEGFRLNAFEGLNTDTSDAGVWMQISCTDPPTFTIHVRNLGPMPLPRGTIVELVATSNGDQVLGTAATSARLDFGQTEIFELAPGITPEDGTMLEARITAEPVALRECNEDNNAVAMTFSCGRSR